MAFLVTLVLGSIVLSFNVGLILFFVFLYDPDNFKTNVVNFCVDAGVYLLDKYVAIREFVKVYIYNPILKPIIEPEYLYLSFNYNNMTCDYSDNILNIEGISYYRIFKVNETKYFKQINNVNNANIISSQHETNNPFMQISIKFDNQEIDITDKLKYFCVTDNIFDHEFFLLFMSYYFDNNIPNEYNVSIMDKEFKMLDISTEQSIVITSDNYEIV